MTVLSVSCSFAVHILDFIYESPKFRCEDSHNIIMKGSCLLSADGRKVTAKLHQAGAEKDYILQRVGASATELPVSCHVSSGECVMMTSCLTLTCNNNNNNEL